jgi:transcription factor HY5
MAAQEQEQQAKTSTTSSLPSSSDRSSSSGPNNLKEGGTVHPALLLARSPTKSGSSARDADDACLHMCVW